MRIFQTEKKPDVMEIPAVSISVDTGSDSGAQSVDTCLEVILDPSKHTPGD